MSRALPLSEVPPFRQGDTSHSALSGRRFRATAGAFDGEAERRAIDALARWVEITYAQALASAAGQVGHVQRAGTSLYVSEPAFKRCRHIRGSRGW